MPRQYSMGGRTPPPGPARNPGQTPPQSIRERVGALRNLPPFLKLVWQTSPAISVALIVLRLIRALLPVATLYVGALIIDAVVKVWSSRSPSSPTSSAAASRSSTLS